MKSSVWLAGVLRESPLEERSFCARASALSAAALGPAALASKTHLPPFTLQPFGPDVRVGVSDSFVCLWITL